MSRRPSRAHRPPDRRAKKDPEVDVLNPEGFRLVLGQQAVREVIRARGPDTHRVFVLSDGGPRVEALSRFAADQGIPVSTLPRSDLDRLASGGLHQGVVALAPPLLLGDWSEVLLKRDLLAVALDGVVDPQNFGAVIRSAVGVARAPILWAESSSAPLSPATFRASAGAIEHAVLCRVPSLAAALSEAASAGVEVLGLAPDAEEFLHEVRVQGPAVLVIGSEQKGMARGVRKACTRLVRLHQTGTVQSLNASVAAGIALHWLATHRNFLPSARSIE